VAHEGIATNEAQFLFCRAILVSATPCLPTHASATPLDTALGLVTLRACSRTVHNCHRRRYIAYVVRRPVLLADSVIRLRQYWQFRVSSPPKRPSLSSCPCKSSGSGGSCLATGGSQVEVSPVTPVKSLLHRQLWKVKNRRWRHELGGGLSENRGRRQGVYASKVKKIECEKKGKWREKRKRCRA